MRRYGTMAFLRRLANSFANGLFAEKVRRRAWRSRAAFLLRSRAAAPLPVDRRKVLFAAFTGAETCNPRAIAERLAAKRPDIDIVWLTDAATWRRTGGRTRTGRAVLRWTSAAFRELATAKVLVENTHMLVTRGNPPKRPGQFYMNTWHGSLGIKRIDVDWNKSDAFRRANVDALDALLVNSDFEEGVFASSPFASAPRFRTGHPRNDVFFLPAEERAAIRRRTLASIGAPEGAKIALFAPTFRDNALSGGRCAYDFDAWARALSRRFGGEWRIALRLHPMDAAALAEGLIRFPPGAIDATGHADVQELLVAADAGITDYSSWIYDFLLGGKPGFIYAPDRAEYEKRRGFYYPLEETPFPVAETNAALCAAIESFDAEKFARDSAAFLSGKGCMDDGKASDRAVAIIEKWLEDGS